MLDLESEIDFDYTFWDIDNSDNGTPSDHR